MAIKAIRFENADNMTRKGFLHIGHLLVAQMKANKRKGDAIVVVNDDGTETKYVLGDHAIDASGNGMTVNVTPGVEP